MSGALDRIIVVLSAATSIGVGVFAFHARAPQRVDVVIANDNRTPAGVRSGRAHHLALEAQLALWHPDGANKPGVEVPAFAESGRPPTIPGPLLRVPMGTITRVIIRNRLRDTLQVHGLHARAEMRASGGVERSAPLPLVLPPGAADTVEFRLDMPGTYYYWGTTTGRALDFRSGLDAQLTGAIVVDDPHEARRADRILVVGMWTDTTGRSRVKRDRVLAVINGRSWPSTERFTYTVGDSVHWRIINASVDAHPMHLHGFYFRIDARGDGQADTAYRDRALAVTDNMGAGGTLRFTWVPERAGNWLFHCHIPDHFEARPSLGMRHGSGTATHANHADGAMSGLVLGIAVRASSVASVRPSEDGNVRRFRLLVRENSSSEIAHRLYSYSVHEGGAEPRLPSGYSPAPVLDLVRDQPVRITVVNQLREPSAVHWHGIELESYFDGVPGFSGVGSRTTPLIAPGDSFEVRFAPPRAGTFIYHTHANEAHQQAAGLIGPIIVREPGTTRDSTRDVPIMIAEDSDVAQSGKRVLVNGVANPPPLQLKVGTTYRLRLIQMAVTWSLVRVEFRRDTALLPWRIVAKDGATRNAAQVAAVPGWLRIGIGEVYDVEITPDVPGDLRIEFRQGLRWPMSATLLSTLPIRVVR